MTLSFFGTSENESPSNSIMHIQYIVAFRFLDSFQFFGLSASLTIFLSMLSKVLIYNCTATFGRQMIDTSILLVAFVHTRIQTPHAYSTAISSRRILHDS